MLGLRTLKWRYVFDEFVQDGYVFELFDLDFKDMLDFIIRPIIFSWFDTRGLICLTFTVRVTLTWSHSFGKRHIFGFLRFLFYNYWLLRNLVIALFTVDSMFWTSIFLLFLLTVMMMVVFSIMLMLLIIQISCELECTFYRCLKQWIYLILVLLLLLRHLSFMIYSQLSLLLLEQASHLLFFLLLVTPNLIFTKLGFIVSVSNEAIERGKGQLMVSLGLVIHSLVGRVQVVEQCENLPVS